MKDFAGAEYIKCKQWAAKMIQNGSTWDDVSNLCVSEGCEEDEFDRLQNEELIIPQKTSESYYVATLGSCKGCKDENSNY